MLYSYGHGHLPNDCGICGGMVDTSSVEAGATRNVAIVFDRPFAEVPTVIAGLAGNMTNAAVGACSVAVIRDSVTADGFTLRIYNGGTAARTLGATWAAIAIPGGGAPIADNGVYMVGSTLVVLRGITASQSGSTLVFD